MRALHPPSSRRIPLAAVFAVVALFACSEPSTTGLLDVPVSFAKGGGGPQVTGADPNTSVPSVTLDVRVIGTGFVNGSEVEFLLAGESTPKIVTNHSTWVDDQNLIANITISADADIALYDIRVRPPRGKNGIGTELFSVKKAGDTGPTYSVEVTELGTLSGATRVLPAAISSSSPGGDIHIVGNSNIDYDDGVPIWHMTLGGAPLALPCDIEGDTRSCAGDSSGGRSIDVTSDGLIVATRRRWSEISCCSTLISAAYWASPTSPNADLPLPTYAAPFEPIWSGAVGVSETGFIAGTVIMWDPSQPLSTRQSRAVLWTPDGANGWTVRDLHEETFVALGSEWGNAHDVNDAGQVVGGSSVGAFVWDDGQVVWLPGVGDVWANAINDASPVQVVGTYQNVPEEDGPGRGVVWTIDNGALVNTVELLTPGGDITGTYAWDINDWGDVVGGYDGKPLLWIRNESSSTGYDVVSLGVGSATAIDNVSIQQDGEVRVVGYIETKPKGKGNRNKELRAVMWTVRLVG